MISAISCKVLALSEIEKYCTEKIEPLLLKSKGNSVYFGKYNKEGTKEYIISSTYAKDPPSLFCIGTPEVNPKHIQSYLNALGYKTEWVIRQEWYEAGYSSSRKTRYYKEGYNNYYTLKISI
jgi:hypothetical protein